MRYRDFSIEPESSTIPIMYRNRQIEREDLELDQLHLQIEQIKAEILKLQADAANEYAQAIQRHNSQNPSE